jgi:6-phosphogluconolactonase (cycloisomerase 2 family)
MVKISKLRMMWLKGLSATLLVVGGMSLSACSSHKTTTLNLCIGTYGEHFYRVPFTDGRFGEASPVKATNAAFVFPTDEGVIYALSDKDPHSGICAFRNDSLIAFNGEIGRGPCHVMQIEGHPFVLTADYNSGTISVFEAVNGMIGNRVQFIRYQGSGPVLSRQQQAHLHQLRDIPKDLCADCGISGEWLLATDLGSDSIHVLRINDTADGSPLLTQCPERTIPLPAGNGPRHLEWNEQKQLLYCIGELSGEVVVWKLTADEGMPVFTFLQRIEADDAHAGGSADIHLHPSGKFLYTSHRLKDDGITLFHVGEDGLLTRIDKVRTEGHPRHFFITPDGRFLLAACRDGQCVQVFAIDARSGKLTATGERLTTGNDRPVCVALIP